MLSTSLSVLAAGALLVLGRPGTPPVDLATRADTLDDGPHVYWRDTRNAVVFYLCGGAVETYELQVSDTLRFTGFCADSATQYRIPAQAPAVAPADYDGAPRILALSDIHGEYDAFVDILQRAGVIDRQLRWTWGNGHVVINGDTFDRGTKVTECLWLIYRLEQEGWIDGEWGRSENNRRARFYSLTRAGRRKMAQEEQRWETARLAIGRVLEATR